MSEQKHGFFGKVIKIIMIIIFFIIGVLHIVGGSLALKNHYYSDGYKWVAIIYLVFGCLLLTSPFFLNQKREGLNKIIKILMVVIFVIIGALFITGGAIVLAEKAYDSGYKWLPICNIVFGSLLFTSPYFLKKD